MKKKSMTPRAQYLRQRRQLHKILGLCTFCNEKTVDGAAYCPNHTRCYRKKLGAWRKESKKLGRCIRYHCSEPAVAGALCEKHHDIRQETRYREQCRVYVLADQRFQDIRAFVYVGSSKDVPARWYRHIEHSNCSGVQKLVKRKLLRMMVLQICYTKSEMRLAEEEWRKRLLALGAPLLNINRAYPVPDIRGLEFRTEDKQ